MAYPERKEVLPVLQTDQLITPMALPLKVRFEVASHYTDKENVLALQSLKEEIKTRLAAKTLNSSQIGTLAAGFVTGRLYRVDTSVPIGLYSLAESGDAVVFHRPDLLRDTWAEYEHGVGPTFQQAMNSIISGLDTSEAIEATS
jgi:hypothetical protein